MNINNKGISSKELNKIDLTRHKLSEGDLIGRLISEIRRLGENVNDKDWQKVLTREYNDGLKAGGAIGGIKPEEEE
jgi:hypothetical protein